MEAYALADEKWRSVGVFREDDIVSVAPFNAIAIHLSDLWAYAGAPTRAFVRRWAAILKGSYNTNMPGWAMGSSVNSDPTRIVLNPGSTLLGSYRVIEELGGGGMARVYKVCHEELEEIRAIKVLRPEMADDSRVTELFIREARVLTRVNHPAVVRCYDFLRDERTGSWCLVMDFVEGEPLSLVLRRGPVPIEQCWVLFKRVAEGLAAAHEKGVVHRDIAPDNLILPKGRPELTKLIDFGIVKLQDPKLETVVGSDFVGKFAYAAPEQFGLFHGEVDARSDYFSLGLVLAEMATGAAVDMGTTAMEAIRLRQTPPELPKGLPAELRTAVEKLVQPDPARRPQNASELLALCRREPANRIGPGSPGTSSSRPRGLGNSDKDRKRIVAALALVALLIAGGGTWWVISGPGNETPGTERAASYERMARNYYEQGDLVRSLAQVQAGLREAPNNEALLALQERVRRAQAERTDSQDGGGQLAEARRLHDDGRLIAAYEAYRGVSAQSPMKKAASRRMADIISEYESRARDLMQAGHLTKAQSAIERGLQTWSDHAGLQALQRQLDKAMDARKRSEKLEALFATARRQLDAGRLVKPQGGNAHETYKEILSIDPANRAAEAGLDEIAGRYAQRASAALQRGAPQESLASIESGLAVAPGDKDLLSLKREAQARLAKLSEQNNVQTGEQRRKGQNEVARLLEQAKAQVQASRLTVPRGNNAYETYREVLALDADNAAAKAGIKEIASSYARRARRRVDNGELEEGMVYIQRGLSVAPGQPELLALKDEITSRLERNSSEPPAHSPAKESRAGAEAPWKNVEVINRSSEKMGGR